MKKLMLIASIGLVALLDLLLTKLGAPGLGALLGWVFLPLAWLLGIESGDVMQAAQLLERSRPAQPMWMRVAMRGTGASRTAFGRSTYRSTA